MQEPWVAALSRVVPDPGAACAPRAGICAGYWGRGKWVILKSSQEACSAANPRN